MHGSLWLGRPGIGKGLVVLLGVSGRMLGVLPSRSGLPWTPRLLTVVEVVRVVPSSCGRRISTSVGFFCFLPIELLSFEGSVSGGSGEAKLLRLLGTLSGQLRVYLAGYPSVGIAGCHRCIGGILGQNFILVGQEGAFRY